MSSEHKDNGADVDDGADVDNRAHLDLGAGDGHSSLWVRGRRMPGAHRDFDGERLLTR